MLFLGGVLEAEAEFDRSVPMLPREPMPMLPMLPREPNKEGSNFFFGSCSENTVLDSGIWDRSGVEYS